MEREVKTTTCLTGIETLREYDDVLCSFMDSFFSSHCDSTIMKNLAVFRRTSDVNVGKISTGIGVWNVSDRSSITDSDSDSSVVIQSDSCDLEGGFRTHGRTFFVSFPLLFPPSLKTLCEKENNRLFFIFLSFTMQRNSIAL